MAAKQGSIRERQDNELEVIKSIFDNVEDLRDCSSGWNPLNLRIFLTPLQGSCGTQKMYVKTKLHIICPKKYPKVPPKIKLEETKGISATLIEEIEGKLQEQANTLKGEVMIYELAQTVQAFLHKHNRPPAGSFYDEMLQQKQKREEELLSQQRLNEDKQKQYLLDAEQRKKEILQCAKRRSTRRSISETNASKNRTKSSSESSENSLQYFGCHNYPNKCTEHRNTATLYFPKVGRKIKRGSCLGHSQKGFFAYSGIDMDTGQLLYITEWNIKYEQAEAKCSTGCYWLSLSKCNGHKVDDLIASIEKHIINLSQLHHKNLVQYECVLCMKRKEGILVYLVQDFVLGTSVLSITNSLGWRFEGANFIAKGVLEALNFLHNKGVSYKCLKSSTVFLDNAGTVRCTNFSLIPNLQELIGTQENSEGDLPALGSLIENMVPTLSTEMIDFIEKCRSDRTFSASDLFDHLFLRPSFLMDIQLKNSFELQNVDRMFAPVVNDEQTFPINKQSRLQIEFEILQEIGRGAFGDVLKVRKVLDNRLYALKRIPLPARSKRLYKKMTREVELVSRLNHENVVRYYNSWIESVDIESQDKMINQWVNDFSISQKSLKSDNLRTVLTAKENSSNIWDNCLLNIDESDSDGIEFVDSNGELVEYEKETASLKEESLNLSENLIQIMYIQMEFCDNFTLRTAIDNNLYENSERLWRLFREIADGLSHIHHQGMIHRDLKPVNIFLDSRDHIKIGDFGLATTSFLALQSQEQHTHSSAVEVVSGTGKVGTTLYVAPELTGNASKSTYSQKVDMYTLGIILFEMSNPPFETGMERVQIIMNLRNPSIIFPQNLIDNEKYKNTAEIIKWLLNHDPSQRPTAQELLASELVPPAQLEANELHEMLRNVLANPQSKTYKHLVARCLQQESDLMLNWTYHLDTFSITPYFDYVKTKIIKIFRRHGGYEINTPLLTPNTKSDYVFNNAVKLMTRSGCVVLLPSELRTDFIKHLSNSKCNMIRRYSISRVYSERTLNTHPYQNYEGAFDIVTPTFGSYLFDAELMSIAFEITSEIPAIFLHCNVPPEKYPELQNIVLNFVENRITKYQLHSCINSIISLPKPCITILIDLLAADVSFSGNRFSVDGTSLKTLIRGNGEAASLARIAIQDLETFVSIVQSLGVTCPIHVLAGLPIGFDRNKNGAFVWQMCGEIEDNLKLVLASGERYDSMLLTKLRKNESITQNKYGAGLSFNIDNLIKSLNKVPIIDCHAIDVIVCVCESTQSIRDITFILRILWTAGVRSQIIEVSKSEDILDIIKELGAIHSIVFGERGAIRIISSLNNSEQYQEKFVTRAELIEYFEKVLKLNVQSMDDTTIATQTSNIKKNFHNNVEVHFMVHQKIQTSSRRRYENQIIQHMTNTLQQFGSKVKFKVIAVILPPLTLNAITGAINPRDITNKETEKEIGFVIERFPKLKSYVLEIFDEIVNTITEKHNTTITALYSITDSSFRIII